jgi:5-(carboxyamino)imidazole ribonucleotide mutase
LVAELGKAAEGLGFRVVIAGAGGAAHLPGMMAAYSELPVIGVPVPLGALQGQDALLSIVQMPRGVPVATVAIGAAANAGLLAVQMLSTSDTERGRVLRRLVREYKKELEKTVLEKAHRFSVEE